MDGLHDAEISIFINITITEAIKYLSIDHDKTSFTIFVYTFQGVGGFQDSTTSVRQRYFNLYFHIYANLSFSISVYTRLNPPRVCLTMVAMSYPSGAFTFATMAACFIRNFSRSLPSSGVTLQYRPP